MEAVLKFNLDDRDDRMAHLRCVKSTELALIIWELFYNFRRELESLPEGDDVIDAVYAKLNSLLDEHGIIIDDLVL